MELAPKAQVLEGVASRDILKFRVSEMAFSGVFKRYFPPRTPCFSSECTQDFRKIGSNAVRNVPAVP